MSLVINNLDKEALKTLIKEVIKEDPSIFKATIKEILEDIGQKKLDSSDISISEEQRKRRERVERIIDNDFKKYDDVFKALA